MKGKKKKVKQRFGSQSSFAGRQDEEKKIVRPVKLKPLKEVLTRLIVQLQRKDDYAFFLRPVDVSQVPGYKDVVQRPMDFGTMANKVHRGKYRSLEDFASDLRLVGSNAKLFNPPGTIYHTEADRILTWGLDHIAKAAPTVIQYETDWNIEIEKDDDGTVNIDDDEEYPEATLMDVDEVGQTGRSPSVVSAIPQGMSRRVTRGPYKKAVPSNTVSEGIDADGRLPGSKDGLAAFPPGSDWARTMLALKLKGKRYKTKKERLRVEKEGPPTHPDGSLDYTQMEDPFAVLSIFAPEPISRPYVTPLFLPLGPSTQPQSQYDPSSSRFQSLPPQSAAPFPASINVSLDYSPPNLTNPINQAPGSTKHRHWVITRNLTRRGKEKDDEPEIQEAPDIQPLRELHAVDFGSFAPLAGALEEEMRRRGITTQEGYDESKTFDVLRESVDCETSANGKQVVPPGSLESTGLGTSDYWNSQRAAAAEEYIRGLVYGGVDGLAYVQSLAEFVTVEQQPQETRACPELGMPLAKWVEENVVDLLTECRHTLLREAALELAILSPSSSSRRLVDEHRSRVSTQVSNALHVYPAATIALAALLQIRTHKIDMASLIQKPEELFLSEEEWAGKVFREARKLHTVGSNNIGTHVTELEVEEPERTWMDVDASLQSAARNGTASGYEMEGPEELNEVLDYVAGVIISLDRKIREGRHFSISGAISESTEAAVGMSLNMELGANKDAVKAEIHGTDVGTVDEPGDDPILRNLRLNLLALAKRAPLDTIARLPKDLVPEHIRQFVPTLGVS